jgi:hypothetical protein
VQITIDMQLLLILLVLVGITLGVFLIVFLVHLISTLKRVSRLVADVQGPVADSVGQLPDLVKRLDTITAELVPLTQSARKSVPAILEDAQAISGTARAGVEAIGGAVRDVGEGVSSFFSPEPAAPAGTLASVVEIVGQIVAIVSQFTGRRTTKGRAGNRKKRRR